MRLRLAWLFCFLCLGCQAPHALESSSVANDTLWEAGQKAMRAGSPDEAIAYYNEGLAHQQAGSRNYLSLAAAYVAKGEDVAACLALAQYVEENPEQRNARYYYAELLRRLGKNQEAHHQFERAAADIQQERKSEYTQLAHCHGRLMELAEVEKDDYQVHLHRGIGLYWLAQGSWSVGAAPAELCPEGLLCKAAGELSQARALRPQEARPAWYLYSVWRSLAQTELAQRCLGEAREAAPFTYLSPAELRSLQLAGTVSDFGRGL